MAISLSLSIQNIPNCLHHTPHYTNNNKINILTKKYHPHNSVPSLQSFTTQSTMLLYIKCGYLIANIIYVCVYNTYMICARAMDSNCCVAGVKENCIFTCWWLENSKQYFHLFFIYRLYSICGCVCVFDVLTMEIVAGAVLHYGIYKIKIQRTKCSFILLIWKCLVTVNSLKGNYRQQVISK